MNREEIIAKVKKMQALVEHESTPENERNTAYNMLQKMMLKYSIEQAELGENKEDTVIMIRVDVGRCKQWQKILSGNIALGMQCDIVRSKTSNTTYDMIFIGHKVDAEVAVYLFETLSRTLSKAGRKQYNQDKMWQYCSEGKYLNSYINGAAKEINQRLVQARKQAENEAECTDLVVVRGKEVAEFVSEQFKNLKPGRRMRVSNIGEEEGRKKGQSVNLQQGIGASQPTGVIK